VNLDYGVQDSITTKIQCEEYYDGQCSTRGNSWAWREAGSDSKYDENEIELEDKTFGSVVIPLPRCVDLVKKINVVKAESIIKINGETFFLIQSSGDKHTYGPSDFNERHKQNIEIEYRVRVEYVPVESS